jgi:tetratricopeptide (TPR) repeat protein
MAGLSVPQILAAQPGGVASACSVDPNSPKELALMELQIQGARSAATPEARMTALRKMIKELDTKTELQQKNPGGYQYRLAQALTMWGMEPDIGYTPVRSALGFESNPTGTIDLVTSLDQAYKGIVAALPDCAAEVKDLRQSEVWLAVTRKALDASNAGTMDSAEIYAKRSLLLSANNPYPHYVLANVANSRKERDAAIGHWKMVVAEAGTDTSYTDLKNSSLYLLSINQLEAAESASGAAKATLGKEAAESFKALIAATPDSPDVPNMMNSLADAYAIAGDSAAIPSIYADMMANPSAHTDLALTMGGVLAVRINKADDAIKLFEGAVAKNAFARDALRNLAATYYGKDMFKEMFAPSHKLVAIDPNNYDGWMMFAYAAQGLAKGSTVVNEKKAWTDSLVKYQTVAEALPVKVDVAAFQRGATEVSLTLQFEQQAATEGTYEVTVEFVDATGSTVGSATSSVGPIKTGESKNATFKAAAPNIVGYRYKSIK